MYRVNPVQAVRAHEAERIAARRAAGLTRHRGRTGTPRSAASPGPGGQRGFVVGGLLLVLTSSSIRVW